MKLRVLLVDDSQIVTNHLSKMLKEVERIETIEIASTLKEARSVVERTKIDVIVLDINLPDGNGLEFLKWIKSDHAGICVIMLSNMSTDVYRRAAEKRGADYFFDKSDDFEIIHKLLEKPDKDCGKVR